MRHHLRDFGGFPPRHFRRHDLTCALVALCLAAAATTGAAQTIVPNPYLDTQLAPWTAFLSSAPDPVGSGGAPNWLATPDFNSSPASGSALIQINTPSQLTNAASGITQCFNFASPTSVTFFNYGMRFFVPATTVRDGSLTANVEVRLFSSAGCSGFISGGSQGQVIANAAVPAATWVALSDNSFIPAGAPLTAASAEVRASLRQNGGALTQASYAINVDQFVLVLNSTTPVQLMQFDVE